MSSPTGKATVRKIGARKNSRSKWDSVLGRGNASEAASSNSPSAENASGSALPKDADVLKRPGRKAGRPPRADAEKQKDDRAGAIPPEVRPFLAYLATERGLAENTLLAYGRDLTDLHAYLAQRGQTIKSATGLDYREYLQDQTRAGQNTKTVARRIAALRAFCKYLAIEGFDKSKDVEQLDRPKPARDLPTVLNREQVERLLAAPVEGIFHHRDVAILELLYASGLRASEICELKLQDANLSVGAVRVLGKGHKERVVPMGQAAVQAIQLYLANTRGLLDKGWGREKMFLSKTGRPLERVALWQIVKRAAAASGVINEVHPHVLRHCFASHLVEGGADLRVVQELLGHADVATTQIYTHVDARRIKKVHALYHPRR